jgi:hypothetical protein
MSSVDFMITHVFDLQGRGGLLVAGHLLSGCVEGGTDLQEATSGMPVRVLGVELHGGAERTTLVIDRRDAEYVKVGNRLTSGV